jgi:hypothetical protein
LCFCFFFFSCFHVFVFSCFMIFLFSYFPLSSYHIWKFVYLRICMFSKCNAHEQNAFRQEDVS